MTDEELLAELGGLGDIPLKDVPSPYGKTAKDLRDAAHRITVCQACPFLKGFDCEKCDCNVYTKARMPEQSCPEGKW